jgi:hypothetical protein
VTFYVETNGARPHVEPQRYDHGAAGYARDDDEALRQDMLALARDWAAVAGDLNDAWRGFMDATVAANEQLRRFQQEMRTLTRRRRTGHRHRGTRAWAHRYYHR